MALRIAGETEDGKPITYDGDDTADALEALDALGDEPRSFQAILSNGDRTWNSVERDRGESPAVRVGEARLWLDEN